MLFLSLSIAILTPVKSSARVLRIKTVFLPFRGNWLFHWYLYLDTWNCLTFRICTRILLNDLLYVFVVFNYEHIQFLIFKPISHFDKMHVVCLGSSSVSDINTISSARAATVESRWFSIFTSSVWISVFLITKFKVILNNVGDKVLLCRY